MARRTLPLLALAFAFAGCRTARPTSLAQWDACIIESERPVLHLRVRWDDDLLSSEHNAAALRADLPGGLVAGTVIPFSASGPAASYREGSESLWFDSSTFTGTVRVVRSTSQEAELELDLRAVSPTVDIQHRGAVPLRGTIRATRVISPLSCY